MQIGTYTSPPRILQIYRDSLKPGAEAAYGRNEENAARICAELGCPHAYMAIESLTGPKEVWYFNGYASAAERQQVGDAYAAREDLLAALERNAAGKKDLILQPVDVFASVRADLTRGAPWTMTRGRFLVITVTRSDRRVDGTVFETPDGVRFIILPAQTRAEADKKARAALRQGSGQAGAETNVFAVRPAWSMAAKEWIAADPSFWRSQR